MLANLATKIKYIYCNVHVIFKYEKGKIIITPLFMST